MQTRVINIRDVEAQAGPSGNWYFGPERGIVMPENMVYIGRPGRGMPGPWGNPIPLTDESQRADVLVKYMGWLEAVLLTDLGVEGQPFHAALRGLIGKTLVCFCKPKACHGDVLVLVATALYPYG